MPEIRHLVAPARAIGVVRSDEGVAVRETSEFVFDVGEEVKSTDTLSRPLAGLSPSPSLSPRSRFRSREGKGLNRLTSSALVG
jgi:hypothetical protein